MEEFDLLKADLLTQSIGGNGGCESTFFDHHYLHSNLNGGGGGGDDEQLRKAAANLRHRRNSKVNICIAITQSMAPEQRSFRIDE